jgi:sugar/nucleoside kinase (ribokinase family)
MSKPERPAQTSSPNLHDNSRPPMVIGGCAVDITATMETNPSTSQLLGTSHPGRIKRTLGGVGCNIARAAFRLGTHPVLISAIGDDANGRWTREVLRTMGMPINGLQVVHQQSTAVYNAIHSSNGELQVAVADMNIFNHLLPERVSHMIYDVEPSYICFDGNITSECMHSIALAGAELNIPVIFEPTSVAKSSRIFQHPGILSTKGIQYVTPNVYELNEMATYMTGKETISVPDNEAVKKLLSLGLDQVVTNASQLATLVPHVLVKLGPHGVVYFGTSNNDVQVVYYPVEEMADISNVTGAGDSFVGALLSGLVIYGSRSLDKVVRIGQRAAVMTLGSEDAVSNRISKQLWSLGEV